MPFVVLSPLFSFLLWGPLFSWRLAVGGSSALHSHHTLIVHCVSLLIGNDTTYLAIYPTTHFFFSFSLFVLRQRSTIMSALDAFVGLSPSQWCQAFFLVATGTILVIQALPDEARSALMNYGARRPQDIAQEKNGPVQKHSSTRRLFDTLTSYGQVSHSWFLHFYILSCSLSAFWIWQYLSKGSIMRAMAELQAGADAPTVELGQVATAWSFMALQGSRRLYESRFVSKPGSSPMWVVHWGLGLVYYVTMSVAVWIEGSSKSPSHRTTLTRG